MDYKRINDIVAAIMIEDGPDGHADGSDKIADFIVALLEGQGEEWFYQYSNREENRKA